MGRTNPTFRDVLRGVQERWTAYRRTLCRHEKPRFDRLLEYADDHADASGYLNHNQAEIPILLSMALEQEGRLDEQKAQLEDLAARLDDLEPALDQQED